MGVFIGRESYSLSSEFFSSFQTFSKRKTEEFREITQPISPVPNKLQHS